MCVCDAYVTCDGFQSRRKGGQEDGRQEGREAGITSKNVACDEAYALLRLL